MSALRVIEFVPGFAAPQTALAPKTGIRRVGTIRNKSAVDKTGASDDSFSAPEVSRARRRSGQPKIKLLAFRL